MNIITSAYAATGTAAPQSSGIEAFIFPIAIIVMLYLVVILPQTRRAKSHRALVGGLQQGDEVVTTGGILGRISKLEDDFVTLSIAQNVDIIIQKGSVAASVPKGTLKW